MSDEITTDAAINDQVYDFGEHLDEADLEDSQAEEVVEEESEEVSEEEPVEEVQGTEEEATEEDGGYYTPEELLEASSDIDAKLDMRRVKPGSLVEKSLKNFQRGYNKKYMEMADIKEELRSDLGREIDDLKNRDSSLKDFYDRQEAVRLQRELEEEEALLPEEERLARQERRELKTQNKNLEDRLAMQEDRFNAFNRDQAARQIERDIDKAAGEFDIDIDDKTTRERINYEIGNVWQADKAAGVPFEQWTPIKEIVERLSTEYDEKSKSMFSAESIDEFLDSESGKKLIDQKIKDRANKIKAKKNSGGKVVTSSLRGESLKDNISEVPDDLDSTNILEYLGAE